MGIHCESAVQANKGVYKLMLVLDFIETFSQLAMASSA